MHQFRIATRLKGIIGDLVWKYSSTALSRITSRRSSACLLIASSPLTKRYCETLSKELNAEGVPNEVVDLSESKSLLDLNSHCLLTLSRRWGAVVSFDHHKWPTPAPEIRLPHGIRANLDWSHKPEKLLTRRGRPRYELIGLPSVESMRLLLKRTPAVSHESLFLVGDLLADQLLSNEFSTEEGLLGVFSGWRPESLVPQLLLETAQYLQSFMKQNHFQQAIMTVHPRVRELPQWPAIEESLKATERVILSSNWETDFSRCTAFLGDSSTSLVDVLRMTNREIWVVDSKKELVDYQSGSPVPWDLGEAATKSVERIVQLLSRASSSGMRNSKIN